MVRIIEEMSLNALPALETMIYDGWVLRFSRGYARRANSIYPLYQSKENINEKISKCEELYKSKGLDVIYKITKAAFPSNLDLLLEEYGYIIDAPTSVQGMNLDNVEEIKNESIICSSTINDEWFHSFCRMDNVSGEKRDVLYNTLENIIPKKFFVSLQRDEKIIGCGLGVLENDFIGLYNIVIDKEYRNKGYGREIVLSLLKLGKENGAKKAYLQVMENNPPALKLYSNVGFKEEYKYWYRVKKRVDLLKG